MATTMLCPSCSVLRLRSNKITNEQTTQLAKRPICPRPPTGSVRSFLPSSQPRGYQISIAWTRASRFRATKVSATPPKLGASPRPCSWRRRNLTVRRKCRLMAHRDWYHRLEFASAFGAVMRRWLARDGLLDVLLVRVDALRPATHVRPLARRSTFEISATIPVRDFLVSAKVPTGLDGAELFYGSHWGLLGQLLVVASGALASSPLMVLHRSVLFHRHSSPDACGQSGAHAGPAR